MLKNSILFLLLTFGLIPTLNIDDQQSSDEAELRHIKEVLWPKSYREQDQELLNEILADEFQMIDSEGNWSNKKSELEYIGKNKPSYDSFRFEIKRLEVFENGTAVVAGKGHIYSSDTEEKHYTTYHSSNILIKREGKWKAISSHVSGVKQQY